MSGWAGGHLAPERAEALLRALRSDPELKESLAQELALLGQIRSVGNPEPRWAELEEVLELLQVEKFHFEEETMRVIHVGFRPKRRALILAWCACFVFGVIALSVFQMNRKDEKSLSETAERQQIESPDKPKSGEFEQVAVVTRSENIGTVGGVAYQKGDRIEAGILSLETGILQMRFLSGATVTLKGPAELDLRNQMLAIVLKGAVIADVPPVAQGFTLEAGGWRAIDRGTVFGIDAKNPGNAEVHVIKGKVDMHRDLDAELDVTLTTGQALQLTGGNKSEMMPTNPDLFPDPQALAKRTDDLNRSKLETWKSQSDRIAADKSLLLYYDFEDVDRSQDIITNRAPRGNVASNGSLVGGQWTTGRWPGKNAVRFSRIGDLIRSLPHAGLQAATFYTSVKLENSDPDSVSPFLLSPEVGKGHVYWMVWPTRFHHDAKPWVFFTKTNSEMVDVPYWETSTLSRPVLGRWIQLAVVHDPEGGEVRMYSDGKLVSTQPIQDKTEINLDEIVIGSWGYTDEPKNLIGCMDEFAIFRRALSSGEIEEIYKNGKP